MALFRPCKPPFLGSYLFCPTSMLGSLSIYWIPVVGGAEFYFFMYALVRGGQHAVYSLFLLIAIFWGNVQMFLKQRSHAMRKTKGAVEIFLEYRQLQIFEKIINTTFRTRVFLPVLCALPLIQIFSGAAFLILFHSESGLTLSILINAWLDAAFAGIISLSAGSVIYTRTKDWILGLFGQDGRKSYGRRVVRSYRPLRLEFGSNYIDRLTPLVIQEFCVRNTASLLLMRGSGKTRLT